RDAGVQRFTPTGARDGRVGLLFFPGALVDPVAYAPLARTVAEAGFDVVILELPRRGAFGGANDPALHARARALLGDAAAPDRWVVGGHSRGGVVASQLAAERPAGLGGLVLVGTTHPRDVDLSDVVVPVTKVVGTRDGLARPAGVEANRHLLPGATRWVWIEGANHSQFGWYGFQPGDRFATISAERQRALTTDAIIETLRAAARPGAAAAPSAS
ncbi:MAG TPA: alpha/beta family hydrolase, partial [Gemmatimonadaceae bacterium]